MEKEINIKAQIANLQNALSVMAENMTLLRKQVQILQQEIEKLNIQQNLAMRYEDGGK